MNQRTQIGARYGKQAAASSAHVLNVRGRTFNTRRRPTSRSSEIRLTAEGSQIHLTVLT
jgi:hypothetical protein